MTRLALSFLLLAACGDDGGDDAVDPTPHLVQNGDAEMDVSALLARDAGEDSNRISVHLRRDFMPFSDGTVRAGPLDAEIELVYDATDGAFKGSFPGEHALVHVSASWSTGSADMVVALPAPIIIAPDPPLVGAAVTMGWQPWAPDRDGVITLRAGKSNSTLLFGDLVTDPAVVTALIVPEMYFPDAGSYFFDAAFDGELGPTGGVSDTTPSFLFVLYTHHLERTIL